MHIRQAGLLLVTTTMLLFGAQLAQAGTVNVTTYHNDNLRTGWNPSETVLTPSAVSGGQFKPVATTPLDEQVDAQPLIVTNQPISGQGTHDVVYVATENDTIYALDAGTGQVLLQQNFGTPVPQSVLPGRCGNNGPNVGITATPVIDTASGTLYAITYTYENSKQIYRIHALDLTNLTDKIAPVVVDATGKLANGTNYRFNAAVSRQRAGLLLANGNVYAAFASFCDISANLSRGWVLGWQANTLTPLSRSKLTNKLATSPDSFFLTSIWMSGYGLASSGAGDIYFVTGNSDYSGTTYNKRLNIAESVVQLPSDLSKVKSLFTPKGPDYGWQRLDQIDADFGSGGAMLLPPQSGQTSNLLVAAGKVGLLYLLNADDLTNGGLKGNRRAYGIFNIGACWCGPSYFTGSDGVGRVVGSGGSAVSVWKVITSGGTKLSQDFSTLNLSTGQLPGFFTSISSNGTTPGTAVIWALGRPVNNNPADVTLYAFDGTAGSELYSAVAGHWPNTGGDANLVPVVANGMVYVAANKSLTIFGLSNRPPVKIAVSREIAQARVALPPGEHEIYGTARRLSGNLLTLEKRDGKSIIVDFTVADRNYQMAEPSVGHALIARGHYDKFGTMHADVLLHAMDNPAMWPSDR